VHARITFLHWGRCFCTGRGQFHTGCGQRSGVSELGKNRAVKRESSSKYVKCPSYSHRVAARNDGGRHHSGASADGGADYGTLSNCELRALGINGIDVAGGLDKVDAETGADWEGLAGWRRNCDRISIGAVNSVC
jgi:hypothetical protein